MIKKIFVVILFFIEINFLNNCSDNSNFKLAEFDGGYVSIEDYTEHFLLSTKFKPDVKPSIENLKEIVLNKGLEEISKIEALNLKIDQDSLYQYLIKNNSRRLLYQNYIKTQVTDLIITDSLMHKFYENFSPQYRMSYIMRPFLKTSTDEFIKSQEKEINLAYKELKNGKSFKDAVEKYSQDITTNKKGGDLGWVINESMGDAILRSMMDTLQQFHFSKPVKGFGGYYILYKGEKRDVNVPKYDEVKNKIWQSLYHSRKAYLEDEVDEKFEVLKNKYHYHFLKNKVDQVLNTLLKAEKISDYSSINFDGLTAEQKNMVIAKYDGGEIYMHNLFIDKKRSPTNMHEFEKQLEVTSKQHLFAKNAIELGLDKNKEMAKQISSMKNSLLSALLYKKLVKDKVEEQLNNVKSLSKMELVKRRADIEKKLRTEYEEQLKEKFHFEFLDNNFIKAIKIAEEKKANQNLDLSKSNN